MVDNFYAILEDGSVRKINLTQDITSSIRDTFINNGNLLLKNERLSNTGSIEEIEFDGNYITQENEILYVNFNLPENVIEASNNSIGIPALNLNTEKIKTLFWYEDKVYYFQNFDNRKLLKNKSVLFYDNQTYSKLEENAFIVEDVVNAIHQNGKFYFKSYSNANKIFSLIEFYQEATNEEIKDFSAHIMISLDEQWFIENSNTVIRKQITLIQKSNILNLADSRKIRASAKKFKLCVDLDHAGKIIFPNNIKVCKEILLFLNEQFYIGLITGNKYKTNSKRDV